MKVLYTTVYGSHLYGTQTPESDQDFKTIFLPDFRSVLLGKQLKTKQSSTSSDDVKNTAEDVDTQLVPLQTFARDFFDGQSYALEVAHHFLGTKSFAVDLANHYLGTLKDYTPTTTFGLFVYDLVTNFSTNDVRAMVGYSWSQAEKYALKGKRQKALENFEGFVQDTLHEMTANARDTRVKELVGYWNHNDPNALLRFAPYMRMDTIEQQTPDGPTRLPVLRVMNKAVLLTVPVRDLLDRVKDQLDKYGHRVKAASKVEEGQVDWKSLYHALRVAMQSVELLETGSLSLPFTGEKLALLMSVRYGLLPLEKVKEEMASMLDRLDNLVVTSKLQPKTEELKAEFEDFLYDWLLVFYFSSGDKVNFFEK